VEILVQESRQPTPDIRLAGDRFFRDERWLNLVETVYGYQVIRLEVRGSDGKLPYSRPAATYRYALSAAH
jgi:hypothetical protein